MPLVFRSNTENPLLASRNQKWLMTANRLMCVALITGALVMCQKYSKISCLLKLLKKTEYADNAFISRKFVSLT
jgi:hypothetical protein